VPADLRKVPVLLKADVVPLCSEKYSLFCTSKVPLLLIVAPV
jgi:hypothetical protein